MGELIAIPLYLSALLGSTPGAIFPQTKEEVLRLFVTQHEQAPEKAEILRKEMFGFHTELLVGLAVEANRTANTVISDTNARRAITETDAGLVANGQLTVPPQPATVLDVLVSSHILLRSSSGAGGISFQHQQFQEWYASFEVGRLMQEAAEGNPDARTRLRADVLNRVPWEESILFACERLSRESPAGTQTVAATILEALGIDPVLAAEMIYRAAPEVWPQIRDRTVAFADRWHKPGQVDRAVRFMITSGRPEFAADIWPLVSSPDNQIYLNALRAARRFRPSVLGDEAAARLGALREDIRSHVVAEIASNSGFDGMELATGIAKTDPSAEVIVEILESLQVRRADRHVGEILQAAPGAVWDLVARKGYPDTLADPSLNARLAELRQAQLTRQTDPIQVIYNLTAPKTGGEAIAGERVAQLIQSADFPVNSQHARAVIRRAFDVYPRYVANALLRRMAAGLELPFRAEEYLKDVPPFEDGPIVAAALDEATPESGVFTVLGPKAVGHLTDRFFALDDEFKLKGRELGEPARKEYHRLMGAIAASRQASFAAALLERAQSDEPARVRLMADLLARQGKGYDEEPLVISEDIRHQLVAVVGQWIELMLTSPKANRHEFSDAARATQRLGQPQHVRGLQQMLERDLTDWGRAREEHLKSPRPGPLTPDVTHSYTLQYQRAFSAIGGAEVIALMKDYLPDLRFGAGAACVLVDIWNRDHPSDKERRFASWYDFSNVKARQAPRQDPQHPPETSDFGEAIFSVVRNLGTHGNDDANQRHALALAKVGLGIPHGTKRPEINALLDLRQPYAVKQQLLTASAIAGEVVPAEVLLAGTQELLELAKRMPGHGVSMRNAGN